MCGNRGRFRNRVPEYNNVNFCGVGNYQYNGQSEFNNVNFGGASNYTYNTPPDYFPSTYGYGQVSNIYNGNKCNKRKECRNRISQYNSINFGGGSNYGYDPSDYYQSNCEYTKGSGINYDNGCNNKYLNLYGGSFVYGSPIYRNKNNYGMIYSKGY
jgi:hypothetical protein